MNTQYLEFVRQQLIVATADLSGATKGQLVAFADNAMFEATPRSRGRMKVVNPANGRLMNPTSPPIPGQQSRAKGSHIPLVNHVEFCTASWRRAVMSLEEHQKAWLLWSYSENTRFEHQVFITQWAWDEFKKIIGTKKVAGKTLERLKALIWLAAQNIKAALSGRDVYQQQELASLCGVKPDNWSHNYSEYWRDMCGIMSRLDGESLLSASRTRSQQKSTFSQQGIAKVN